ncbi:HNH endonuclease [Streptomonospora sp. PA3]|nr:HNH endonuclease [Streptomonospora sp. PA3]MUL41515.1 HNH endonuclease [Streptomonospora sp. PA3]
MTPAEHRRRQKQLREERKRANGPVEKIDRAEIGDRDGWVCGLCRDPIDRSYRYPDPRAASVDHIRSIAGGGTETRDNVQIAHWGCNHERNADDVYASVEEAEAVRAEIARIPYLAKHAETMDPEEMMRRSQERNRPEEFRKMLARRVAKWELIQNLVFEAADPDFVFEGDDIEE